MAASGIQAHGMFPVANRCVKGCPVAETEVEKKTGETRTKPMQGFQFIYLLTYMASCPHACPPTCLPTLRLCPHTRVDFNVGDEQIQHSTPSSGVRRSAARRSAERKRTQQRGQAQLIASMFLTRHSTAQHRAMLHTTPQKRTERNSIEHNRTTQNSTVQHRV